MTFEVLERVAAPLGLGLDVVPRWHGEGLDRLLDEAHASLVDALVRRFNEARWNVAVEVSFAIDGERGSIDVLPFHPATAVLAVSEVKSVVPDVQAMIHGLDRKARLAARIGASRGWRSEFVLRMLVLNDDRTARRRVERHASVFDAAYPVRGRDSAAWIRDPASSRNALPADRRLASALIFLPSVRRVNATGASGGRHRVRSSTTCLS
jgi:hypothetical protein